MVDFASSDWATTVRLVGIVGVVIYVGGYAALQLGCLRGASYAYAALNAFAASCVLVSLTQDFNLSSALIQTTWIAISIAGMARLYLMGLRARFTAEERLLVETTLPSIDKRHARRFLDAGEWLRLPAGALLTREGVAVGHLVYLAEGRASVTIDATEIAQVSAGDLVGELTVLDAAAATATVRASGPVRVFRVPAERVRVLARTAPDLDTALRRIIMRETRRKLSASNRKAGGAESGALAAV